MKEIEVMRRKESFVNDDPESDTLYIATKEAEEDGFVIARSLYQQMKNERLKLVLLVPLV